MQTLKSLLWIPCLLGISVTAVAQDDPFAADPFARPPKASDTDEGRNSLLEKERAQEAAADKAAEAQRQSRSARPDPFRGGDDPFGGRTQSRASDDPFAGDPFGDSGKNRTTRSPSARADSSDKKKATQVPAHRVAADAEARIQAALSEETTHTFVEFPLEAAVQQISRSHKIPIIVDKRALEEIGLSGEEPINISLNNVTLRSFLRLMLRGLDLTYMIKDEVMQITTIEAAEQNLLLETYSFPVELADKADKVVSALTANVNPSSWATAGGPGNVSTIENVLVVSATADVHDGVVEFLQKLETAFHAHKAKQ